MRKVKVKSFLAEITSSAYDGLDSKEIDNIFKDLINQSDRNAVIVASSIIDDILSLQIRALVKCGTLQEQNALFSDRGPFGSMYSKIEWLYCLGKLPAFVRKDINIIRTIRNDAAHKWRGFDLADDNYTKALKKMRVYSAVDQIKNSLAQEEKLSSADYVHMEPKVCFCLLSSILIILLGSQTKNY